MRPGSAGGIAACGDGEPHGFAYDVSVFAANAQFCITKRSFDVPFQSNADAEYASGYAVYEPIAAGGKSTRYTTNHAVNESSKEPRTPFCSGKAMIQIVASQCEMRQTSRYYELRVWTILDIMNHTFVS